MNLEIRELLQQAAPNDIAPLDLAAVRQLALRRTFHRRCLVSAVSAVVVLPLALLGGVAISELTPQDPRVGGYQGRVSDAALSIESTGNGPAAASDLRDGVQTIVRLDLPGLLVNTGPPLQVTKLRIADTTIAMTPTSTEFPAGGRLPLSFYEGMPCSSAPTVPLDATLLVSVVRAGIPDVLRVPLPPAITSTNSDSTNDAAGQATDLQEAIRGVCPA